MYICKNVAFTCILENISYYKWIQNILFQYVHNDLIWVYLMLVWNFVSVYVCKYVYTYIHIYKHTYIHIYIYMHACIHTYIYTLTYNNTVYLGAFLSHVRVTNTQSNIS